MKFIIIFVFLTSYVAADTNLTFIQWQLKNMKLFLTLKELKQREEVFLENKNLIITYNSNPENTFEMDLNPFAHLTGEEFITSYCGTKLPQRLIDEPTATIEDPVDFDSGSLSVKISGYPFGNYTATTAPSSVNFTHLMQPVQIQGKCNACWAFSAMSQIEAMLKIRDSSYNTVLSRQFLVDCDKTNYGCSGGWPSNTMYWLKTRSGGNNKAPSSLLYPYRGTSGICLNILLQIPLGIDFVREEFLGGDENALKTRVANFGPIVAALYATSRLQFYKSGIFYDSACPSTCTSFNHAVVVVGYGSDPVLGDYWIIKNSWGNGWGEQGYVRMARNKPKTCNLPCYVMFIQ